MINVVINAAVFHERDELVLNRVYPGEDIFQFLSSAVSNALEDPRIVLYSNRESILDRVAPFFSETVFMPELKKHEAPVPMLIRKDAQRLLSHDEYWDCIDTSTFLFLNPQCGTISADKIAKVFEATLEHRGQVFVSSRVLEGNEHPSFANQVIPPLDDELFFETDTHLLSVPYDVKGCVLPEHQYLITPRKKILGSQRLSRLHVVDYAVCGMSSPLFVRNAMYRTSMSKVLPDPSNGVAYPLAYRLPFFKMARTTNLLGDVGDVL